MAASHIVSASTCAFTNKKARDRRPRTPIQHQGAPLAGLPRLLFGAAPTRLRTEHGCHPHQASAILTVPVNATVLSIRMRLGALGTDLNLQPTPYESAALPLSYEGLIKPA